MKSQALNTFFFSYIGYVRNITPRNADPMRVSEINEKKIFFAAISAMLANFPFISTNILTFSSFFWYIGSKDSFSPILNQFSLKMILNLKKSNVYDIRFRCFNKENIDVCNS